MECTKTLRIGLDESSGVAQGIRHGLCCWLWSHCAGLFFFDPIQDAKSLVGGEFWAVPGIIGVNYGAVRLTLITEEFYGIHGNVNLCPPVTFVLFRERKKKGNTYSYVQSCTNVTTTVVCGFFFIFCTVTNKCTQLSHKLSHCYMFRHSHVIPRQPVINTLPSYTSISNAAVGNTVYS